MTDKEQVDPLSREMHGLIGEGARLSGEFFFEGGYRVDGKLHGRVTATSALIVGPSGAIESEELRAESLLVSGEVRGHLHVDSRLEIQPGGRVLGTVTLDAPGFVLAPGGVFEGTLSMRPPDSSSS